MAITPSSHPPAAMVDVSNGSGGQRGGSFAEMVTFMREGRRHSKKAQMDVKLHDTRQQMEAKLSEAQSQMEAAKLDAVTAAEQKIALTVAEQKIALTVLQLRLESMHAAELLANEELHALEDAIVESLDAAEGDDDRVARMVALSGWMASDAAFSRQLRD